MTRRLPAWRQSEPVPCGWRLSYDSDLMAGGLGWRGPGCGSRGPSQAVSCVSQVVSTAGVATANHDDILLTEQPLDRSVPAYVGQRLVVTLTNSGGGAWAALHVEGSAVTMLGDIGAYDYPCRGAPPLAELTILRAEIPGVVTLSSSTDAAACTHNGAAPSLNGSGGGP